ncbi:MAG: enoyl-CoA hydratase-related protein [Roseinatronobacter sp.]
MSYPPDWRPTQVFGEGRVGLSIDKGIGIIAIQIPDKMNALDAMATAALVEALEAARDHARVLVLTGAGGKAFISGADIGGFDSPQRPEDSFLTRQKVLRDYPLPTIAAIRGYCIGGGLMTALNCDIRLAARDASFGIPAARLGISYGYDGLAALVAAVGPARARRLLYVGDRIDAETALNWGLIEHLHSPQDLWPETMAMAGRIAQNAPLSITATKAIVAAVLRDPDARDMDAIRQMSERCLKSADFREGRNAFHQKRQPEFRGC